MLSLRSLVMISLLLFAGCATAGAASGSHADAEGLVLRTVDQSVYKPGNIAVYFTVEGVNGEPVPGMKSEELRIYEDGEVVSRFESGHTLINPLPYVNYTLVLVDISNSVLQSGYLRQVQPLLTATTKRASPNNLVAVYLFDGSPKLTELSAFDSAAKNVELVGVAPADPSTNLNGAIVDGLKLLDDTVSRAEQPLKLGTLVVMTDGSDHASRVPQRAMLAALDHSDLDIIVIGTGAETDKAKLERLGQDGMLLMKPTAEQLATSLDDVFSRIERSTKRFYLLSYCSPARAGQHELAIEAVAANGAKGRLKYKFSAAGFGPGCDAKAPVPASDALNKPQRWQQRRKGGAEGQHTLAPAHL